MVLFYKLKPHYRENDMKINNIRKKLAAAILIHVETTYFYSHCTIQNFVSIIKFMIKPDFSNRIVHLTGI